LERFDPDFTPNTTDLNGRRYNFRSQPEARVVIDAAKLPLQWQC